MRLLLFLVLLVLPKGETRLIGACPWGCSPIKQCDLIFRDLLTAKGARDRGEDALVDKIVRLVRQYICDDRAEQVCCPEFLGTFNNSVTRATEPVYAVSSDTIVVRSRTEPVGWSDAEAFFWKEEACFPGRHTRWRKGPIPALKDLEVERDRSGLELNLLEETSEVEELHLKLPPLFDVHDLRCLSVWEGDSELGAAFLRFPTRVPKIG